VQTSPTLNGSKLNSTFILLMNHHFDKTQWEEVIAPLNGWAGMPKVMLNHTSGLGLGVSVSLCGVSLCFLLLGGSHGIVTALKVEH
jgi:hypothetical protein